MLRDALKRRTIPAISVSIFSECGTSNYTRQRIVGGTEVRVHEFPWQAAIVGYYDITPFCGGVLISPTWLLTAAHCSHE